MSLQVSLCQRRVLPTMDNSTVGPFVTAITLPLKLQKPLSQELSPHVREENVTEGCTSRCVTWAGRTVMVVGKKRKRRNLTGEMEIVTVTRSSPSCGCTVQLRIRNFPDTQRCCWSKSWSVCLYQLHTWLPHVHLLFSKLVCTKCFSTITVRTDKMSCGSCNNDSSQPLEIVSQWFLQHCPQLNGPELCINASRSCAESCMWGTGTHMLSLDRALSLCVRTAWISCLVPHSCTWGCFVFSSPCITPISIETRDSLELRGE